MLDATTVRKEDTNKASLACLALTSASSDCTDLLLHFLSLLLIVLPLPLCDVVLARRREGIEKLAEEAEELFGGEPARVFGEQAAHLVVLRSRKR